MKCFIHKNEDAVGICKSCGKGICMQCTTELINGISCKNDSCEKRVNLINKMLDNNAVIISVSNKHVKRMAYISIMLGILFVIFGGLLFVNDKIFGMVTVIMGIVFIVFGIFNKKVQFPTTAIEKK